jgi:hypothetical protein
MSHSFHIIGQMDTGQHPVHPGFGQDDGLDDAANLLVGDTAGNGTAPVYAVTSAAGTFMFAVVGVPIVVGLRPHGQQAMGATYEALEQIFPRGMGIKSAGAPGLGVGTGDSLS